MPPASHYVMVPGTGARVRVAIPIAGGVCLVATLMLISALFGHWYLSLVDYSRLLVFVFARLASARLCSRPGGQRLWCFPLASWCKGNSMRYRLRTLLILLAVLPPLLWIGWTKYEARRGVTLRPPSV
jgi:hypothetical protein